MVKRPLYEANIHRGGAEDAETAQRRELNPLRCLCVSAVKRLADCATRALTEFLSLNP